MSTPQAQEFLFDTGAAGGSGGVEMAALWLRLRRAVVVHSTAGSPQGQHDPEDTVPQARCTSSIVGVGGNSGGEEQVGKGPGEEAEKGGRAAGGDAFGLEGFVDLSRVGAGLFRQRDPSGSGDVSPELFQEV